MKTNTPPRRIKTVKQLHAWLYRRRTKPAAAVKVHLLGGPYAGQQMALTTDGTAVFRVNHMHGKYSRIDRDDQAVKIYRSALHADYAIWEAM